MTQKRTGEEDQLLGQKVREARTLRGYSQARLADHLGLSSQQVQKYENGVNRISSISLFRIAKILELPVAFFYQDIANTNDSRYKDLKPETIHLIDVYNQLPAHKQSAILDIMKIMLGEK